MKTPTPRIITLILLSLAFPLIADAAAVSLNANDAAGSTSWNTAGHWSNAAIPSVGNDYNTAGFLLRTPGDLVSYTFAGASLTFGVNNGGSSLLEKSSAGNGQTRTLTINNATNLAGAVIRSGGTVGSQIHIAGNHYAIAGSSQFLADQCVWIIDSPLLGGDSVILTNSANNNPDHVSFTATNSGFTGSWYLTAANNSWSVQLDNLYSLPGNPSTLNLGQITFLGGGQIRDTVGCSFTNSNGGITLAANGVINASAITTIAEPITDLTNGVHSVSSLTSSGVGTLVLSNANNNYAGGTIVSAGVLQMGVVNALPGNTTAGDVTVNATLDLNGKNTAINGLNGSGTVDNTAAGSATFTIGANGNNGTFTGTIQNSSGALALTKIGAGTETLGGFTYSGNTTIAGGTLNLNTAGSLPSTPGNLIVSNAVVSINASSGASLPANSVLIATNGTVTLTLNSAASGINASGNITFQDNATNNFNFGTIGANPSAAAINIAGSISAPGSNVVINIAATGLGTGTFTLIKYGTGTLDSIANFQVSPPPGVAAILVNNTANKSIDLQITSIPNQLAWNGVNGTTWDLSSANWANIVAGGITVFRQYTNGSVIAGDSVLLDDTVTNDFVNPQPTNINLTAKFFAYPVAVNSTLPYSIAGAGGIAGVTSLVKSNTGSLTLLTSNSFTGGVSINDSGALIITNDSALGASSGAVVLNGATLQMNGSVSNSRAISMPTASIIGVGAGATATLGGTISGAGANLNKSDNGTLVLAARETFTGNIFLHGGTTIIDTGGSITNGSYHDVAQNGTDAATLTMRGTGSLLTTSDFNVGDLDSSAGILNVTNSATLTANAIFIGSANASGSTASGVVNQSGGTVTEVSAAVGTFAIGGRNSVSGVGVYNLSGGTLTANAGIRVGGTGIGTLNQSGGLINAIGGINIARIAGSFGTNNLNGGTLSTLNVASSTGINAVFNFNGGTLQANFNPQTTTWFSGGIQANILAGGAFVDSSNFNVTISTPLLAGSANGGLTKLGSGTLNLTGTNTFTGPVTNRAGTLFLNSPSTYAGAVAVNAGTLQVASATVIQGTTTVTNGATLAISQQGVATTILSNLTLNGGTVLPGATISLAPTNTAAVLVNCGTLTLNGTNSINLPVQAVGTIALIKYFAFTGSGTCTNLILPQGATGYISNSVANSTLYAVVTGTGPGIFWTGTNNIAGRTNLWDINTSTNWVLGSTPTSYRQVVVPGDLVTFSDIGTGIVIVSNTVAPTSITISNNAKAYAFNGPGNISGPAGIQKIGPGTAVLSLTNNNYSGGTTISNGVLQAGNASVLSPTTTALVGPAGTLQLAGFSQTVGELAGSGFVDNNSGNDLILTVGSSAGSTWNGNIQDHGAGGVALTKNGAGTWVVGGANRFSHGGAFTVQTLFNAGTTILTNGGSMLIPFEQTWIANGAGSTASLIIAGGTLSVTNNILAVGYSTNAVGTLVVNSGTVFHSGPAGNAFGQGNNIIVGGLGGTGTLTVNGGQVLNSQALWLGQNSPGSGTLNLNGGLVQATVVQGNNTPATSIANFNGGTLQATTNNADYLQVTSMVMSNGLVLDDNGFTLNISSQALQSGDAFNGGLIKKGAGTVYLDAGNTYTGVTVVTNGTLAGIGSVAGPVVVAPAGTIGAGNASGIGIFTISGNLNVQGKANLRIDKTGGNPTSDLINGVSEATYGGSLVVTNTTSDATPLVAGDTFTLFSTTTHIGTFASIIGSPGAGLAYRFNPTNGVLSVVAFTTASNPTNITFSVSGNTLALSWPLDHLGWFLQSQTNSLATGLKNNWVDVAGSDSVTQTNITINPANPTAFFRLRAP